MLQGLTSAVLLFLLDWRSKTIVSGRFEDSGWSVGPMVRIHRVVHVSGRYKSREYRAALLCTWIVALASALLLHRFGVRFQSHIALWGLGAAFGGAAGNLRDIFRRHSVIDFIDFGWWPVFNLADMGIVAGLAVAFLG